MRPALLHVTNGESAGNTLRQTAIGGAVLPWRDALHEGPVPALPRQELLRARACFLAECGWGRQQALLASLERRDQQLLDVLRDDLPVVLWFEHDVYDQLQLLDVLALAHAAEAAPELIVIGSFPGKASFAGLGELTASELETLWSSRRRAEPGGSRGRGGRVGGCPGAGAHVTGRVGDAADDAPTVSRARAAAAARGTAGANRRPLGNGAARTRRDRHRRPHTCRRLRRRATNRGRPVPRRHLVLPRPLRARAGHKQTRRDRGRGSPSAAAPTRRRPALRPPPAAAHSNRGTHPARRSRPSRTPRYRPLDRRQPHHAREHLAMAPHQPEACSTIPTLVDPAAKARLPPGPLSWRFQEPPAVSTGTRWTGRPHQGSAAVRRGRTRLDPHVRDLRHRLLEGADRPEAACGDVGGDRPPGAGLGRHVRQGRRRPRGAAARDHRPRGRRSADLERGRDLHGHPERRDLQLRGAEPRARARGARVSHPLGHRDDRPRVRGMGCRLRRAAARDVRDRDLGCPEAAARPRTRPVRDQAALLPRPGRRAVLRLRARCAPERRARSRRTGGLPRDEHGAGATLDLPRDPQAPAGPRARLESRDGLDLALCAAWAAARARRRRRRARRGVPGAAARFGAGASRVGRAGRGAALGRRGLGLAHRARCRGVLGRGTTFSIGFEEHSFDELRGRARSLPATGRGIGISSCGRTRRCCSRLSRMPSTSLSPIRPRSLPTSSRGLQRRT